MKLRMMVATTALMLAGLTTVSAQQADPRFKSPADGTPYRNDKVEPFKVIGNIYFVGTTQHNLSWLVTTPQGHMIIDTLFEKDVPAILDNIKKLGFKQEDIKYILTLHAHGDHAAGHAAMQEATGAQILAPEEDAVVIETGGKADPHGSAWTPAKVDKRIVDGETLTLGGMTLTAHLTPGHTKGCNSWTTVVEEEGKKYNVVFMCGLRMDGTTLLDDPDYPDIASDFAGSFKTMRTLPADVFLGGHGYWFSFGEKIKRMKSGEGYKAWIDPEGYKSSIEGWQEIYVDQLLKEAMAKKAAEKK